MNHESAMQCALGYAWGHEDGSKVPTYEPPETSSGAFKFAQAFAQGWDEYNSERRGMMTSVTAAYARWQATSGATIWDEYARPAKPVPTERGARELDIETHCLACGSRLVPGIGEESAQWRTSPGGKYFCAVSTDALHHPASLPTGDDQS